jgi:hypothetical protein
MATPHFGFQLSDDLLCIESPAFFSQNDLERDIQQKITKLGLKLGIVTGGDCVADLVGFFQQVGDQGLRSLRGVPRTIGA